jgi:hypothetical protein
MAAGFDTAPPQLFLGQHVGGGEGHPERERRAVSGGRHGFHVAPRVLGEGVHRGETQAGAAALTLGGEERIEDAPCPLTVSRWQLKVMSATR